MHKYPYAAMAIAALEKGLHSGGHVRQVVAYGFTQTEAQQYAAWLDSAGVQHSEAACQDKVAVTLSFPRQE